MDNAQIVMLRLQTQASEADRLRERARTMLSDAVRAGHRAGLTQKQIAQSIGRSQPEVSRLLHFHGTSPLGLMLRKKRVELIATARQRGVSNVRVFGSLVNGVDPSDGTIDLLVECQHGASGSDLSALSAELGNILGTGVSLISDTALKRNPSDRALAEAVDL